LYPTAVKLARWRFIVFVSTLPFGLLFLVLSFFTGVISAFLGPYMVIMGLISVIGTVATWRRWSRLRRATAEQAAAAGWL
jgi:hypothetical protein